MFQQGHCAVCRLGETELGMDSQRSMKQRVCILNVGLPQSVVPIWPGAGYKTFMWNLILEINAKKLHFEADPIPVPLLFKENYSVWPIVLGAMFEFLIVFTEQSCSVDTAVLNQDNNDIM